MTEYPRSRLHLPHPGWFLLATVVLVVGYVGLSVWLPYHWEQEVARKIKSWGGGVGIEAGGPQWLRRLVADDGMKELKVYDRIVVVDLRGTEIADAEIAQLSGL